MDPKHRFLPTVGIVLSALSFIAWMTGLALTILRRLPFDAFFLPALLVGLLGFACSLSALFMSSGRYRVVSLVLSAVNAVPLGLILIIRFIMIFL